MTTKTPSSNQTRKSSDQLFWIALSIVLAAGLLVAGYALFTSPVGATMLYGLNWLFSVNSTQLWWYVTRSAGVVAYLLLWFSVAWGLAIPSKIFSSFLSQEFTFDFHEFISLLTIGFVVLHVSVLMVDRYLPYTIWQILVPFLSTYRPIWVGLGILSFYLIILVTITFYMRNRIGMKSFRAIHWLSFAAYISVAFHGIYAGTDSPLVAMQLLYRVTALVIIFLTVYWLVLKMRKKPSPAQVSTQTKSKSKQNPHPLNVPLRGKNQIQR
jgi:methionine sulfoxide reductase heme-binding subunit